MLSQAIQRTSSIIMRKPIIKKQAFIVNAENQPHSVGRDPLDLIKDKLKSSHCDEPQLPKILGLQPDQSVTKPAITSNPLPCYREDQQPVDTATFNSDMDIIVENQSPLFETSNKVAPVSPPHGTPATITSEVESRPDCKSECESLLEEQRRIISGLEDENEVLRQDITLWKNRAITAASKNVNVPIHMPLSLPESELLKAWKNLAFEVKNFVVDHFERVSSNNRASWVKEHGEFLREITPAYQQATKRDQSFLAMIEAAIWYSLCRLVFVGYRDHSPMRWAGDYEKALTSFGEFYV